MSDSDIFVCKHCGKEHEAITQEVASYFCPNLEKPKENIKVLDKVMRDHLTEFNSFSETQEPNTMMKENNHGKESNKASSTDWDSRPYAREAHSPSTRREPK